MLAKLLKYIINNSKLFLFLTLLLCTFLSFFAPNLKLDASSSSLFMEDDKDLITYKEINKDFEGEDFLVLAFIPKSDPFKELALIKQIHDKLMAFDSIKAVLDLSNAALFKQGKLGSTKNLLDKNIDFKSAKKEIFENPFYLENIISKDGSTTSFIIFTKENKKVDYKALRALAKEYEDKGQLIVGGVDVIVYDMLKYIKNDLLSYTISLILFLALMLYIFFRSFKFVALALGICLVVLSSCSGLFALLGFKITIISSNFVALVLIITISMIIHIYVYFLQVQRKYKKSSIKKMVLLAMLAKAKPCFFSIFTTIIGFLSLVFSDILPVSELGLMMSIGVLLALVLVYLFMLCLLIYANKRNFKLKDGNFLKSLARGAIKYRLIICSLAFLSLIFSFFGLMRLGAENSFVAYFKDSSKIKQGLLLIDKKLGGTMPLDLIINFPKEKQSTSLDDFEAEFSSLERQDKYFFTAKKLRIAKEISQYLDKNKYIGKQLSLNSLVQMGEIITNKPLDSFALGVLYDKLDPSFKAQILSPFVNIEKNQLRFSLRILDSDKSLKRDLFLKELQAGIGKILEKEGVSYKLAGMVVLYNNVLQSIFSSQTKSMGFILLSIFLVFVFIFKSFKFAFYGIITSIVPLFFIFAMMGYLNITLDIMSISIGAICIGLGIDNIIHYIDRYKEELRKGKGAIIRTHKSVGSAIYYTSFSLIIGFMMMCTSKFIPIIYFGVLTILVMALLLLSTLLFLPALLSFKRY